jgi:glutathione S-transferase
MLTIYGILASPFVARCVLALRLKGVKFELKAPPGGLKSPEFLKISPFGKVPVIEDEGFTLPESEVICEYIEDRFPEPALLPKDAEGRARSRLVSRIVDLYLIPSMFALSRQADPGRRNDDMVATKLGDFAHATAALEHVLGEGPYAVGKEFTMADCTLTTAMFHLGRIIPDFVPEPFEELPKLAAYQAMIAASKDHSAFEKEMADSWAAMMRGR